MKKQTVIRVEVILEDNELEEITNNGAIAVGDAIERAVHNTVLDSKMWVRGMSIIPMEVENV